MLYWGNHIRIELNDLLAYKWASYGRTLFRGYLISDNRFMSAAEATEYFETFSTTDEIQKKLPFLEGSYNVIAQRQDGFFACVDSVRSMPLFYRSTKNEIFLYDALPSEKVIPENIDSDALNLYYHALFTVGETTFLKNVYQIPAGNSLRYGGSHVELTPHSVFQYASTEKKITDLKYAVQVLDAVYLATFQRLIRCLNGRTAVLPLSGGHDSRLIAYYLKQRLGYQNIIAYSYGCQGGAGRMEAIVSRQVANVLDIPWLYVEQMPRQMHQLFLREYPAFSSLAGNCSSVPCLQEWYTIFQLKQQSALPQNSVIIPGYSGDFLAGTHLLNRAHQKNSYCSEDILHYIEMHYFGERGALSSATVSYLVDQLIKELPALADNKRIFELDEANELIERFDNDNRQAKFIVNAVRVYDYFGYQWVLPFFERGQYRTWSRIDNTLRYSRKAFFELERAVYPSGLQEIPFESETIEPWIMRRLKMLKYGASYSHYIYGYYHLGGRYYRDMLCNRLKSVNMYAQDAYLNTTSQERVE